MKLKRKIVFLNHLCLKIQSKYILLSYFPNIICISFRYSRVNVDLNGQSIELFALTSSSTDYDLTGTIVWPISEVTSIFLSKNKSRFWFIQSYQGIHQFFWLNFQVHPKQVCIRIRSRNWLLSI